jgi:hypothetical protein
VGLEAESEDAILGLAEEALVILALVFVGNFGTRLEEGREEMRGVRRDGRRLWDQGWHVGYWDRLCRAVVEDDEILRGRVGVQRDIRNSAGKTLFR